MHMVSVWLYGCSLVVSVSVILGTYVKLWFFELIASQSTVVLLVGAASFLLASGMLFVRHGVPYAPIVCWVGVASLICMIAAVLSIVMALPRDAPPQPGSATTVRFATFNKLHDNTRYDTVAQYLLSMHVDVIALQEASDADIRQIATRAGYLHYTLSDSKNTSHSTAVGIVSRLPLHHVRVVPLDGGYSIVRAEVDTGAYGRVAVYSVHIMPPFSNDMYARGLSQFDTLARTVSEERLPVILGGDLNTTMFSPKMRSLRQALSRSSTLVAGGTWPTCSWYGYGSALCMRIDHIFVPNDSRISHVAVSPYIGSDHCMVVATVEM